MPTFTVESELPASAPQIWRSMKDAPTLLPKIAPQAVGSIDVEGNDGELGAIRVIKFGTAAPPGSFVKEKLLALDHQTFSVTSEEVAGGHLAQGYSKWVTTVKFVPVSDSTSKYEGTVDYEGPENEAGLARSKEGMTKLYLGLAAYLTKTGAYA